MQSLKITIFGKVQNVFFRDSTKQEAEKLNIKGYVRNMPDGSVYIEAVGTQKDLEKFIEWCKDGPELASVDKIEVEEGEIENYNDFRVLRSKDLQNP